MIRPKRIITQIVKELTQLGRDRLTMTMALALPIVFLLLFGFAVSLDVNNINLAIQDLDNTPTSREYIATFERTERFKVVAKGPNVDVSQMLGQSKISAGLIIPLNFTRDLQRPGRQAQVQLLVDGSDANTANIAQGYASATTNAFVENLQAVSQPTAVSVESRLWYNPGLETLRYIGPGAVALVLFIYPPLLSGLATAKELDQATILQVYASSLSCTEYLLGKAAAYWIVGMAEVLLVNLPAWLIFGIWFAGDPTPLIVGTMFYIACGVLWGIFVGNNAKNQSAVILAVTLSSFLPSLLLSGYIYPVSNIPIGFRWLANVVPARYYILLTRDAFNRGVGWPLVWLSVIALVILASFFFFLSWRKMRPMQVGG
jgi:ABC-2 type transport system permease protein